MGFPCARPAARPTRDPQPPQSPDAHSAETGSASSAEAPGAPPPHTRTCRLRGRLLTRQRSGRRGGLPSATESPRRLVPGGVTDASATAKPCAGAGRRTPPLRPRAQRACELGLAGRTAGHGTAGLRPQGPSRATGTGGPRFPNQEARQPGPIPSARFLLPPGKPQAPPNQAPAPARTTSPSSVRTPEEQGPAGPTWRVIAKSESGFPGS